MNDSILQRMLAPVVRRIQLLLGRGVLTGVNDALKAQNMQITAMDDETFDEVERLQQYGQISVPLPGAEVVFGCLGAQRDQAVILVAEDRRYRPTGLPAGDSGLYHFEGHRIRLTKEGRCIITCKTIEVFADEHMLVDTPKTIYTGDVEIQGNLNIKGKSESEGTFTAPEAIIGGVKQTGHRHHENGQGSLTGGPQ